MHNLRVKIDFTECQKCIILVITSSDALRVPSKNQALRKYCTHVSKLNHCLYLLVYFHFYIIT